MKKIAEILIITISILSFIALIVVITMILTTTTL